MSTAPAIKALTVQQPWAWAIFHGKNVENRTQLWRYRGPLAIHAGLAWASNGDRDMRVRSAVADHLVANDEDAAREWARSKRMPHSFAEFGALIGIVDLVDVHTATVECSWTGPCARWGDLPHDGRGDDGRFERRRPIVHLVLEDPRPLTHPVRCKGALGLWTPPPDVTQAIADQQVVEQ